jgi:hypothetical protein
MLLLPTPAQHPAPAAADPARTCHQSQLLLLLLLLVLPQHCVCQWLQAVEELPN